jgi:hypothetical protein
MERCFFLESWVAKVSLSSVRVSRELNSLPAACTSHGCGVRALNKRAIKPHSPFIAFSVPAHLAQCSRQAAPQKHGERPASKMSIYIKF